LPKQADIKCDACKGTGFQVVEQPPEPTKRVYPPPCKVCGGKGRVKKADD
jgi:DnaJ-class molecular chaperone